MFGWFRRKRVIDLVGIYMVTGARAPANNPYVAEAVITRRGEVYEIQWWSGPNWWRGLGILSGDILSVAILDGGGSGIISYHVKPSRCGVSLIGRWAYAVDTLTSSEIMQRVMQLPDGYQSTAPASPQPAQSSSPSPIKDSYWRWN